MYATYLLREETLSFTVEKGRQAYLVLIEGWANVNDIPMDERDAMEVTEEEIIIMAKNNSHFLLIEMEKE